tara:strand:- start:140 stop:628 length:489 start_codon:yes stop_codon:yes gene_type:complete
MFTKKERNIFMTKLWDTLKNKVKSIKELSREFPNKTYRELEKYRDADRNEEAQQIFLQQENEELTESQQKQAELEPIEGVDWEKLYNKEHKLRQEAETETILVKGIGMNSPEMKNAQAKLSYLQDELDRVKRENNDLHNKVAALLDAVDPATTVQKARESGL